MITENLSTLKIHKLTQAQYDRELEACRIDGSSIYLTPEEEIDFPVDSVNGKTGAVALNASDVGALPVNLTENVHYGNTLPASGETGQVFFKIGVTPEDIGAASATQLDAIEAQAAYTAMMTDTLLEV